jgi:uncharacterized protein YjcR
MIQKLQTLIIILLACICLYLGLNQPKVIPSNNQEEIKLLLSKIDSLEEVKAKVDTIYREQVVNAVEVIKLRPKNDNLDSLNNHIDTLEYTLMKTINSADNLIENLQEINSKQREIIKLSQQDYESILNQNNKLQFENKFLKITAGGLVVVSVLLLILK